jgi:histidyl-tRNA synthetase
MKAIHKHFQDTLPLQLADGSIQAVRGMRDILATETPDWVEVEDIARRVLADYGYEELRLPILEQTQLFARAIGAETDIVAKEMYTFTDRNGDSLTLRPEGTAGVVRAGVENGLFHNQTRRLWYAGPMFRHERPQRGRYRQFHQIGAEAVGWVGPDIDAELMVLTARLWRELNLRGLTLEINSLGDNACHERYRARLVAYLERYAQDLDADSRRRLESNPLRILDSKDPGTRRVLEDAPSLQEELDPGSRRQLEWIEERLSACGVSFRVNPRLVRGLDYYTRTVFEWVTEELGAQNTVCAGGRYDRLIEQLGGRPTPAAGFALGMERLLELRRAQGSAVVPSQDGVYLVMAGEAARATGFVLAERWRDAGLHVLTHAGEGGIGSQMKRADKSGARVAAILGDDEVTGDAVTIKPLRAGQNGQTRVPVAQALEALRAVLAG